MEYRIKHLGIGVLTTLAGVAEYLIYRPWGNGNGTFIDLPIRLIDKTGSIEKYLHSIPNYFGDIHGIMPHYLEGIACSMIVLGLSNAKTKTRQFSRVALVSGVLSLREICQYFGVISGECDYRDVLAILGGALTTLGISVLMTRSETLE